MNLCVRVCAYLNMCSCVCVCVCVNVSMCVCACVCVVSSPYTFQFSGVPLLQTT